VAGVQTNLALLRAVLAHPGFAAEKFDTGFLARHPELATDPEAPPDLAIAAAALSELSARAAAPDPHSPWSAQDSWRPNLPGHQTILLRHRDTTFEITASPANDAWQLAWSGSTRTAQARPHPRSTDDAMLIRLDTSTARATILHDAARITVVLDGANHDFDLLDPHAPPAATAGAAARIASPIPGRVARVLVAPGDSVAAGQVLLVVEAMKMELPIAAAAAATVLTIRCAEGEMVAEGVELVELGPPD
jgi:3-methylcrotonyl-CoA carboxylase alpha subunit